MFAIGKQEIAAALKTARIFRGLTQSDAAKATGLTYQAISNYERGTNRVDSLTLDKLCSLYRISVESVLNCKDWDDDSYTEDFLRARSDAEKKQILQSCGPCSRFICEYNEYVVSEDSKIVKSINDLSPIEQAIIKELRLRPDDQTKAFLSLLQGKKKQ